MATLKNDLSLHNLTFEDAIEMALDKPLWGLLAASGATHWWCMPNNDDDDEYIQTMWRLTFIFTMEIILPFYVVLYWYLINPALVNSIQQGRDAVWNYATSILKFTVEQGSYRSQKTGKSQGIWVVRERSGVNEKLMPPDVSFSD